MFTDTIKAPYLRITPGHIANIGEKDTLFKDREPSKTIPYSAARTYIAHIGEYPPPPRGAKRPQEANCSIHVQSYKSNCFAMQSIMGCYFWLLLRGKRGFVWRRRYI